MSKPTVCSGTVSFLLWMESCPNNQWLPHYLQSLLLQTLNARIAHLIKHWPSDLVRPSSVSVQNYLGSRLPKSEGGTADPQHQGKSPLSESSVNALYSLLDNRYSKRYPLPHKLRYPASNPEHYDAVVREFEEAPSRNWLGRLGKKLRGMFRFQ